MSRLVAFLVVVLALGLGFAWLAERPGDMVITWQGQRIEMSLMVAVTIIASLVAAVMLTWWLIKAVVTSPQAMQRYFRARKRDRGYQALSTGLIAAGAGDAGTAGRMFKRARGLISADQEPLLHLLEAQTALIEGRHEDARAKFETMADDPETQALAWRGLYLEARRLGADEAARQYAEKAAEAAPHLPWAAQASLEYRSREGDWDGALALLDRQRAAKVVDKSAADRKQAVLLTARAMERFDGEPQTAQSDALAALKLAPDLVPAAVTAARALFRDGNLRKGARILEKIWRIEPHPHVGDTYVRARIGDSPQDRLKRARKLEALKPNHIESLLVVAHAALDAQDFKLARTKAEAAARQHPREGIFLLLADIEEAETGDQGRVRHWLAQAVRAPRDPAWTADGYVTETWRPVSPVTGALDALQWRAPVETLHPALEAGEAPASLAEEAIRSLPATAARPADRTGTTAKDDTEEAGLQNSSAEPSSAGQSGDDDAGKTHQQLASTSAPSNAPDTVSPGTGKEHAATRPDNVAATDRPRAIDRFGHAPVPPVREDAKKPLSSDGEVGRPEETATRPAFGIQADPESAAATTADRQGPASAVILAHPSAPERAPAGEDRGASGGRTAAAKDIAAGRSQRSDAEQATIRDAVFDDTESEVAKRYPRVQPDDPGIEQGDDEIASKRRFKLF